MRILSKTTGVATRVLLIFMLFTFVAQSAAALAIDSSNGGLGQAKVCSDMTCVGASQLFNVVSDNGTVSGSLDIALGVLDFTVTLTGATVDGSDGGVSAIGFDVTYTGSVNVTQSGSTWTVDFGQYAAISGTATPVGAGSPAAIAASQSLVAGTCGDLGGGALDCGLVFAPFNDFDAEINGYTRHFEHSVNLFTVPEPGTATLLGLGLLGLAGARRENLA